MENLFRHRRTGFPSSRPFAQATLGSSKNNIMSTFWKNEVARDSLSCSCVAVNNRDPALDFDGSEMLTIRLASSAVRGARGGPTHSERTAEVGRP